MKTTVSKKACIKTALGVLFLFLFVSNTTYAQDIQVKGTVSGTIDGEVETLMGANIFLKGTSVGTSTDKKGKFTFPRKLKAGDILVFSYLGQGKKEVTINRKSRYLTIVLQEDQTYILGALNSKKTLQI